MKLLNHCEFTETGYGVILLIKSLLYVRCLTVTYGYANEINGISLNNILLCFVFANSCG